MRTPTPKAAVDFRVTLSKLLQSIAKQATAPLRDGELYPDDGDEVTREALRQAEAQLLDTHQVQCGRTSVSFRELEARLAELEPRLTRCLADSVPVTAEDLATLTEIGQLLEKRPPSEDRGNFEADIATLPLGSQKGLDQLLASIRVSLRLPSTTAHLQVANIALQADVEPGEQGLVARLRVNFQAYLRGQQGDSLADMLKLTKVRLALPGQGPLELPLQVLKRVLAEPEEAGTAAQALAVAA